MSDVPLQNTLYRNDKYIIQKLSFEGGYFALLKVLNQLQNADRIGMIRSFVLKMQKANSNADAGKIVMDVYFEIIT